jgi:hypothetical protein
LATLKQKGAEMLDALVNFAMMNVVFIVVATVVGVYALVRLTTGAKGESAQVESPPSAVDEDRAAAHDSMDIHSRV